MRKLGFVALLASACFLGLGSAANATSVNLRWSGGAVSAGSITGLGTSSVTFAASTFATLTLDIRINVDSAGLSSAFLSLDFDTDLKNELNIVSFAELSWTGAKMTKVVPNLTQLDPGLQLTQESTSLLTGKLYTFEATTLGTGPVSTTIAFGRVVFTTNHPNAQEFRDGADVFSGLLNAGLDGMFNNAGASIAKSTKFGTAAVNQIPEPSTLGLLALGLGALVVAGRRSRS